MTWADLFERAERHDVTESDVIEALRERRGGDGAERAADDP